MSIDTFVNSKIRANFVDWSVCYMYWSVYYIYWSVYYMCWSIYYMYWSVYYIDHLSSLLLPLSHNFSVWILLVSTSFWALISYVVSQFGSNFVSVCYIQGSDMYACLRKTQYIFLLLPYIVKLSCHQPD